MSRKHTGEEFALGSDSFLDVLCNMVGILVILIVIAGLRVSRTPPQIDPAEVDAAIGLTSSDKPGPFVVSLGGAAAFPTRHVPVETPKPTPAVPLAPPEPPAEFVEEAERLRTQLAELTTKIEQQQDSAQARPAADPQKTRVSIEEVELAIQEEVVALQNETRTRQLKQLKLDELKQAYAKAQAELALLEQQQSKTQVIRHNLSPLAKVVSSREVHFRLSGGRVSFVPIDELVETLHSQIMRQKDFILSRDRYVSTVGPIDGYKMEFAIERQRAGNISDELKYGQQMVRMIVSGWVVRPEADSQGETVEQALKPGSRFRQGLVNAGQLATVTFWVYPDSFELHRKLQDFAYQEGHNVAARPLPDGVPIAGSPSGSKSMAQ
jgi:hypothetical protein